MTARRWIRLLRSLAGTLLLLAVAYAVMPARFGGRTTFVVVQGASMEPRYHSGDLIYARGGGPAAKAGDIVVYRIPATEPGAGRLIVHRLQRPSTDATGRVTGWEVKGDNRQTADATHPTDADIVARPVLNLGPNATRLLLMIPLLFALATAVIVGWMLWPDPIPVVADADAPNDSDGDDHGDDARAADRRVIDEIGRPDPDDDLVGAGLRVDHRDDLDAAFDELDLAEPALATVGSWGPPDHHDGGAGIAGIAGGAGVAGIAGVAGGPWLSDGDAT